MRRLLFTLLLLCCSFSVSAQDWTDRPWAASWITHPTAPATEFAVVNFRRTFEVEVMPDSLPVMVSADNRYQLFVNGQRVGEGPARGDLKHWRYETFDLRPYIRMGENVIAAIVWNYGMDKPYSQESYRLGFLLQPKSAELTELKTDENWKTYHNEAYTPITGAGARLGAYYVAGPQLRIDGNKMPWGWEQNNYPDEAWPRAQTITRGSPAAGGTETYWGLVLREIPMLEYRNLAPLFTEKLVAGRFAPNYPAPDQPLLVRPQLGGAIGSIPPNSKKSYLVDYRKLRNLEVTFVVNGGQNANIRVTYAESLFDEEGEKGNRGEVDGKFMKGVFDEFIVGDKRQPANESRFTPLWFRTARYVQIDIETQEAPIFQVEIESHKEVAYPFQEKGSFQRLSYPTSTDKIWEIGWQTARMCAQETYVDCPYYEQLQYVGDTRIQALISLYVSGDDRLMRKAIKIFDESRTSEGLTQSRYPSNVPQFIPPYSLSWVEMVGDYWMHRPDTTFIRERLEGVRAVLNWYDQQLLPNGMIGPTPYWNFVDWTPEWSWDNEYRVGGVPDLEGGSSIISLQYVSALRVAERLYEYFGDWQQAAIYGVKADQVTRAVTQLCWKADRGLFSDTPKGDAFSQHANILALLNHLAPAAAPEIMQEGSKGIPLFQNNLLEKILKEEGLIQVSEYFRFYLVQAMYHTGNAYLYTDQLKVWESYLDQGFTTFPEKPGKTRSDCHAWSASPNYDLLATLAGIRPASPGFKEVSVRPAHLPGLEYYATAAHPQGEVKVNCSGEVGLHAGQYFLRYNVTLPTDTKGVFTYRDQSFPLRTGKQEIKVDLGEEKGGDWRRH